MIQMDNREYLFADAYAIVARQVTPELGYAHSPHLFIYGGIEPERLAFAIDPDRGIQRPEESLFVVDRLLVHLISLMP